MRIATAFITILLFSCVGMASAQTTGDFIDFPVDADYKAPYSLGTYDDGELIGRHSGARAVSGPFDMDGDGKIEVLLADYSGGGRVHVIENVGPDLWELVYSTPWLDSTATSSFNARYVYGTNADADLDGDGFGEIIVPTGAGFEDTTAYGLYIFEHTGTDNDYGDEPAAILSYFDEDISDRVYVQGNIAVEDVDGDGEQELIFPNNGGAGDYGDNWFIYSVDGDIGSDFETWVQEAAPHADSGRGGGSPWTIYPADLDGDGSPELQMHSWNSYNFTNGQATGANTYEFPKNQNFQAEQEAAGGTGQDAVAFAGGTVIDINQDGDDEVFYINYNGAFSESIRSLSVINYEDGEDVMSVTQDNFKMAVVDDFVLWGITGGDLDADGQMEIIGAGPGYAGTEYSNGEPSTFIRIAEFIGGTGADPEDPANWAMEKAIDTSHPVDTTDFNIIHRDSLGTESTYHETNGDAAFPFRLAYLGDADGDGFNEVALGFQGVSDSILVIQEEWNADSTKYIRTDTTVQVAEARPFLRVLQGGNLVTIKNERIILPSEYKLSANFPNPFQGSTKFTIELPLQKDVSVRIYDVLGRVVKTLVNDRTFAAGTYPIQWDGTNDAGTDVASGVYFYTLQFGNFQRTKQMTLIK